MRSRAILLLMLGCVPRGPTRAPVVVEEVAAERLPALPVVAVKPAPVRPLAYFGVLAHNLEDPDVWWTIGGALLPLTAEQAGVLGATERVRMADAPRALRGFAPLQWLGDSLLLEDWTEQRHRVVLVSPALERRWQVRLDPDGVSTMTPHGLVFEHDAVLVGYARSDGRPVWRFAGDVPTDPGEEAWWPGRGLHMHVDGERLFVTAGGEVVALDVATGARLWGVQSGRVERMSTDAGRLFVHGKDELLALDGTTGARLWSAVREGVGCDLAAGSGVIVVRGAVGYRVLDPASGATLRTLAGPDCSTRPHSWPESMVVEAGRLVAAEVHREGHTLPSTPGTLRSFDLARGVEVWRRPIREVPLMLADRDELLLVDQGLVLAVDAADGATRVAIDVGYNPRVNLHHGMPFRLAGGDVAAGPLVLIHGDDTGRWILGRRAEPMVREAYEIRGRVVPGDRKARGRIADVPVTVGGVHVHSDADGRFVARGAGLGVVTVAAATDRWFDGEGTRLRFDTRQVTLAGAGVYEVEVRLEVVRRCLPGEDEELKKCDDEWKGNWNW